MKKLAIIGAGNMGGAIARGLAAKTSLEITVSNPSMPKLEALKAEFPQLTVTTSNLKACIDADTVLLAVKPWILPGVLKEIGKVTDMSRITLISVAGGVSIDDLDRMLIDHCNLRSHELPAVFHVIPDTAISICKSMTFIAAARAEQALVDEVAALFKPLGDVAVIEERLMGAATALSSCGIAYAYKYVQACVQAGVQLGFYPADALRYVNATVDGAIAMLRHNGTTPQQEIDKVTTPGGLTIKGINSLEHDGFTSAVINAILAGK